jgi:predicted RNA binding protein YcfA (HicA-like mRNA interferase family)
MGLKDLPLAVGKRHVAAFRRAGWEVVRQRGSHVVLSRAGRILVVPCHDHDVKRPLLARLVERAELTIEEYCEHFYR